MERSDLLSGYFLYELASPHEICPEFRREKLDAAIESLTAHLSPETVLSLSCLDKIGRKYAGKSILCVLEENIAVISRFRVIHGRDQFMIANGLFREMPLDYDKFDLVVCSDVFDISDSASIMDEARRVLKDGGYFLFSGVVLPDADSEGIYDEMMKKINPLHSDYYLESDLLTFARLKGFEPAGSHKIVFRRNVSAMTDYFAQTFGNSDFPAADSDFSGFMKANNEVLSSVYSYDGNDIDEHYTVSLFKRAVL